MNLNDVTLKDENPILIANMLINLALRHIVLIFMDGNASYNQVYNTKDNVAKIMIKCPSTLGTSKGW